MPVETFAYINSLNPSNPPGSDGLAQGDDHIRGIKTALTNSFTGITGATNVTQTTLNSLQAETHTRFCPVGMIADFLITPPTGWLECNGQAVSRTTYAGLFAVYGTFFGVGDGVSTFNVPNMTDRYRRQRGIYTQNQTLSWQVGTHGHTASASSSSSASTSVTVNSGGSHTHSTGGQDALHFHSFSTTSNPGNHSHGGFTGGTDRSIDHLHDGGGLFDTASGNNFAGGGTPAVIAVNSGGVEQTGAADRSLDHLHSISADGSHTHSGDTGIGLGGAYGNGDHTHGEVSTHSGHTHTASASTSVTTSTSVTVNNSTTQENVPNTFVVITAVKT